MIYRLIFYRGRKRKFFWKEHNLVAKCLKCEKYSLTRFADFVMIVFRANIFEPKIKTISERNTNIHKLRKAISSTLQHLATKHCNCTDTLSRCSDLLIVF